MFFAFKQQKVMKKFSSLLLASLMALTQTFHSVQTAASPYDPGVGAYTLNIPANLESRIERTEADNAVHYTFKTSGGESLYLFSIKKASYEQWNILRTQLENESLIGSKDNLIYYVEVTNRRSLKGQDKQAYAEVYAQLDSIIDSIKL